MKRMLMVILAILLVVILVAGGYVAYLFIDYSRLEDNLVLTVENSAQAAMTTGDEKSIISWNVGFGAYTPDFSFFMDGGTDSRARSAEVSAANIQGAAEYIQARRPDLILIQELDVKGTRSCGVNQQQLMQQAFAESHSAVFAQNYNSGYLFYPLHKPIGAARSGILTLSNARIDSALRRTLPIEMGFRKFFDLDRCYSVSRIPTDDGRELCLYNLHLSAYSSDGSISTEQLGIMLGDMQAEYQAGNYVIAGGDFNKDLWGDSAAVTGIGGQDNSWDKPFPTELLPEGFRLVDSLDAENPVLSCRDTGAPYEKGVSYEVTLDGFIVSANVEVTACSVLDAGFAYSDHNPVAMNFVLKSE